MRGFVIGIGHSSRKQSDLSVLETYEHNILFAEIRPAISILGQSDVDDLHGILQRQFNPVFPLTTNAPNTE